MNTEMSFINSNSSNNFNSTVLTNTNLLDKRINTTSNQIVKNPGLRKTIENSPGKKYKNMFNSDIISCID